MRNLALAVALLALAILTPPHLAAQSAYQTTTSAQPVVIQTQYALIAVSATGGASTQVTLTIPTPPPTFYNYVCTIHFNASHDNTATTALSNGVTTSTNFNSWALKFSLNNVANQNYDWFDAWGIANVGCARSAAAGTATTFVSPTGTANMQFEWDATYYQAP
jgi:hypothetical protein